MSKWIVTLLVIVLIQANPTIVRAEFIGNAFGGQAEEATRAGASRVFQGYETFYAGMSKLEGRAAGPAREQFQKALALFQEGQKEYQNAARLLVGKPFVVSRLEPAQATLLFQFLEPFEAKRESDQAGILQAYAASFSQTVALLRAGSAEMTLSKFREIQTFINRQILVGTFISHAMRGA